MKLNALHREMLARLVPLLGDRESRQVVRWVIGHFVPQEHPALLGQSDHMPAPEQVTAIHAATDRIAAGEPVQYVLEEAWFDGLRLHVTPAVLVPRPETEELAVLAAGLVPESGTLLDVGTGSGCIALALKNRLPKADVWAIDISGEALTIARENADAHQLNVHFRQIDVLDSSQWAALPEVDAIISNPPYIRQAEQAQMPPSVVKHEPHVALFVPDGDPMLFYRTLAALGKVVLKPGGHILAEMHEELAHAALEIFRQAGYINLKVHTDMQGKERFISAIRP